MPAGKTVAPIPLCVPKVRASAADGDLKDIDDQGAADDRNSQQERLEAPFGPKKRHSDDQQKGQQYVRRTGDRGRLENSVKRGRNSCVDELQYKEVDGSRFLIDRVLAYLDADNGQYQRQQNRKSTFLGERGPRRLLPT